MNEEFLSTSNFGSIVNKLKISVCDDVKKREKNPRKNILYARLISFARMYFEGEFYLTDKNYLFSTRGFGIKGVEDVSQIDATFSVSENINALMDMKIINVIKRGSIFSSTLKSSIREALLSGKALFQKNVVLDVGGDMVGNVSFIEPGVCRVFFSPKNGGSVCSFK